MTQLNAVEKNYIICKMSGPYIMMMMIGDVTLSVSSVMLSV